MNLKSVASVRASRLRRGPDVLPLLFLAMALMISLVVLVQLAVIIWLSVRTGSPGASGRYSWINYVSVFTDRTTLTVLVNTFEFSSISLVVALAFGVPISWIVERTDFGGKTLVFTMMTAGLVIPGFATAIGWLFMLHPRIGLLNNWMMQLFDLPNAPLNIATVPGMGWVQGLSLAPVAFIMTSAVFRAMDPGLEEAAQVSGAGLLTTLRRVTLPVASPGIFAASIYIFTIGFAAFDVPAIIGWSNRIFTFSTYIYLLTNPQDPLPRYGSAAALSAFMMALAALLTWGYSRMYRRSRRYAVITGKAYRPRAIALGRARAGAWLFVGAYFALSDILPILVLAWSSLLPFFQPPSSAAFAMASLAHFRDQPWELVATGARNTAILMLLTPTVSLCFAIALSWIILRSSIRWRGLFDFIAFLPHAVPNIIFGVGAMLLALFVLRRVAPLYGTIWLLLIVYSVVQISYATRMTNSGLIQIHTELEESALISGSSLFQMFRRILTPLLSPTLLYAWLWIALLIFRELTIAVILSTGQNMTLPVVIWSLWLSGGLGQASALALIELAFMLPLIALYWTISRRRSSLSP